MKVRIKDTIYDDDKEPIMIILTDQDKKNIANMLPEKYKYISYPDEMAGEKIRKWIDKIKIK